jgi:hypothetical protein
LRDLPLKIFTRPLALDSYWNFQRAHNYQIFFNERLINNIGGSCKEKYQAGLTVDHGIGYADCYLMIEVPFAA